MSHLNIEIKAKCYYPHIARAYLKFNKAKFIGVDNQIDTYFNCRDGRLKLREGNIENCLVQYNREDLANAKASYVNLFYSSPDSSLKEILTKSLGVLAVVSKYREIYFIDNVKFHIDQVEGLGDFIEIEAIGTEEQFDTLQQQCQFYIKQLCIRQEDLITCSYSDLILNPVKE